MVETFFSFFKHFKALQVARKPETVPGTGWLAAANLSPSLHMQGKRPSPSHRYFDGRLDALTFNL